LPWRTGATQEGEVVSGTAGENGQSVPECFWGLDYGTTNVALGVVDLAGDHQWDFAKLDRAKSTLDNYDRITRLLLPHRPADPGGVSAWVEYSFYRESYKVFANMVRVRTLIELVLDQLQIPHESMGDGKWKKMLLGTTRIKKDVIHEQLEGRWSLEGATKQQRGHVMDALSIAETARRVYLGLPGEDRRELREHH
jgi:Holliday junction resolvasome RuvABC endonuclease subunit